MTRVRQNHTPQAPLGSENAIIRPGLLNKINQKYTDKIKHQSESKVSNKPLSHRIAQQLRTGNKEKQEHTKSTPQQNPDNTSRSHISKQESVPQQIQSNTSRSSISGQSSTHQQIQSSTGTGRDLEYSDSQNSAIDNALQKLGLGIKGRVSTDALPRNMQQFLYGTQDKKLQSLTQTPDYIGFGGSRMQPFTTRQNNIFEPESQKNRVIIEPIYDNSAGRTPIENNDNQHSKPTTEQPNATTAKATNNAYTHNYNDFLKTATPEVQKPFGKLNQQNIDSQLKKEEKNRQATQARKDMFDNGKQLRNAMIQEIEQRKDEKELQKQKLENLQQQTEDIKGELNQDIACMTEEIESLPEGMEVRQFHPNFREMTRELLRKTKSETQGNLNQILQALNSKCNSAQTDVQNNLKEIRKVADIKLFHAKYSDNDQTNIKESRFYEQVDAYVYCPERGANIEYIKDFKSIIQKGIEQSTQSVKNNISEIVNSAPKGEISDDLQKLCETELHEQNNQFIENIRPIVQNNCNIMTEIVKRQSGNIPSPYTATQLPEIYQNYREINKFLLDSMHK